jgi:glycosyltransferase involved in cell wall biosynthesis
MTPIQTERPKILFVDPFFGALGGGVMVSCWIVQALSPTHDLTWLSWHGLDLEKLDRFAGTTLSGTKFRQTQAPAWLRVLGETLNSLDRADYNIQRWSLLMRHVRSMALSYDLTICCNDEMDMGAPGIQYIHYPYLNQFFQRTVGGPLSIRLQFRNRPWMRTSGFDPARFVANTTLANSSWTGDVIRQAYGIESQTLYPPVPGEFAPLPWEARDHTAICVGRLGQDKRLETIVDIVEKTRQNDPTLRLRIVGVPYTGPGGDEGLAFAKYADEHYDWVDLHMDLPRDALVDMMCRSRIGIHAKEDEHFGISVAEMARAGAAVFVHNSGGQVEIVGADPRLTYSDAQDAASKITALLSNTALRRDVLKNLTIQCENFTTSYFCHEFQALVAQTLKRQSSLK